MILWYQFTLLFAFLIGGYLGGNWITRGMAFVFHECRHVPFLSITAARNYPYYYIWRNILAYLWKKENGIMYKYKPSVPVVYLYGKDKMFGFQFHTPRWINYLQTTKGCEVHALSGEHWLMRLHPKFITDLIARRL